MSSMSSPPLVGQGFNRRIPSLDGIRGYGVLVVIGAHVLVPKVQKDSQPAVALHHVGFAFVTEFLVISGFLITLLLIRERDKTGTIALWKFYKRRVIRLWPALWVVVGTTAVIGWLGYVQVDAENLLTPLFFVTNYFDQNGNAVLGHTWSLALEEQFYLIWPLAIIVLGRKNLPRTLAILILIAPIVRIASYYMIPALRGTMQYQFHIRYDAMAMGCLLAITWGHPRVQRFMAKPGPWGWLAAVGLFVSLGGELLRSAVLAHGGIQRPVAVPGDADGARCVPLSRQNRESPQSEIVRRPRPHELQPLSMATDVCADSVGMARALAGGAGGDVRGGNRVVPRAGEALHENGTKEAGRGQCCC